MDSIPYHVQGNTIEFLQVSSGIAPLYPCRISTGISEGEGIAELINPDEPMATGRCNASWNSEHHMIMMKKNMVTMVYVIYTYIYIYYLYIPSCRYTMVTNTMTLGTFLAYENWHGGCLKRKSPGNAQGVSDPTTGRQTSRVPPKTKNIPKPWEFSNPTQKG